MVGVGLGPLLLGEPIKPSAVLGGLVVAARVGLASATLSIAPIAAWSVRLRPVRIG